MRPTITYLTNPNLVARKISDLKHQCAAAVINYWPHQVRSFAHRSRFRVGQHPSNTLSCYQNRQPGKTRRTAAAMADELQESILQKVDDRGEGRRGGRGGRGRGRGGGGGGGGGQSRDVLVSKALSKLLRHQAENAGISLDEEGFAPLDRVFSWGPIRSLKVSLAEIQNIVSSNDKQRFSLKPNPATNPALSMDSTDPSDYLIRANQGHSIKVESSSLLEPITAGPDGGNIPPRVLHGTYFAFWPAIVASGGLKPMGRNHVHCSAGTPEDGGVVSGMRRDAELVVEIDVERSLLEGVKWWKSDNSVLLTEGGEDGILSTRFFKKVTGRKVDVGVLWENGEKKADLPEGVKGRIPNGKGPRGGGRGGRGGQRGSS